MKGFLLFLFLFSCAFAEAQIVNIPDAALKSILINGIIGDGSEFTDLNNEVIPDVDINNDGEIQLSEAQNILECNLTSYDLEIVSFAGLESFTNLKTLWLFHFTASDFSTLNISAFINLENLGINNAYIPALDLSALVNLNYLMLDRVPVDNLNVSGLVNLEEFHYGSDNINFPDHRGATILDVSSLSSLRRLTCFDGILTNLVLTGCTSLEHLECSNNLITELDISGLTSLEYFSCWNNYITSALDFTSTNAIEFIYCQNNSIPELILSNKPNLLAVRAYDNLLTELNLGSMPQLRNIECQRNLFTTLDFSGVSDAFAVSMGESHLNFINLKNGGPYRPRITWYPNLGTESTMPVYICVDEQYETVIRNQFASSETDFIIGSYCTFTPGGNYNTITGTLTFDANTNGCDATDTVMPFASVQINDGAIAGNSYSSSGIYNFYTQAGTFTLTPQFENDWFIAQPVTVTFANNNNNVTTQNFCVTANGVHNDAEVIIVTIQPARPGFDAIYKIIYKNKGNQTLSDNVNVAYDDEVLDYVEASVAPSSSATGSLTWSYTNLLPFETREIVLTVNVNGPMETPAVNIDDALTLLATITPVLGDETLTDNVFALTQTVVGSYDPNDITCLEGVTVSTDKIGEYLHYNINFENTGTAPATFIVVKDVIDTTKYDVSTLQVLNTSHPMEARVKGNKTEFIFDNINLEASGKGNITFKIKTLETLTVNSSVTQQADIFFDYNWPVVTNEATTTFAVLSTGDFANDNSVTVSPNPANGIVNISAKAEIKSVQLYDVQGRLLQAGAGTTIDVSSRAAGIYFVKVMTAKGMKVEKLVKK